MNEGWRAISAIGRAGALSALAADSGMRTRLTTAMARKQKAMREAKVARYSGCAKSRVCRLTSGPMMPPARPPARTYEIAFALKSLAAASAAANR
jgi:hypothetical protein